MECQKYTICKSKTWIFHDCKQLCKKTLLLIIVWFDKCVYKYRFSTRPCFYTSAIRFFSNRLLCHKKAAAVITYSFQKTQALGPFSECAALAIVDFYMKYKVHQYTSVTFSNPWAALYYLNYCLHSITDMLMIQNY